MKNYNKIWHKKETHRDHLTQTNEDGDYLNMKIETSLEWGEQQDTGEKSYTITKSRKTQQHNTREDKDYQNKTGRSNIWIITQNQCGVRGLVHTVSTFSLKCFQGNLSHVGPNGSLQ